MNPLNREAPVLVAGAETLIGSALVRRLRAAGFAQLLTPAVTELPCSDAVAVSAYFALHRPVSVFVAAGRSGGIEANRLYPADLATDNLKTTVNLIDAANVYGTERLLYLGSSCCYPRECPQPMEVPSLGSGPLEPTSEAYASVKLAGLALVRAMRQQFGKRFVAGIPADVYGPYAAGRSVNSHVIPSLITRFADAARSQAPEVTIWGTGCPRREFLYVDDLADACILALDCYDADPPINLGGGHERSIREAAEAIASITNYRGRLAFDTTRPDGAPRKLLDSRVIMALGWRPATPFETGLRKTYEAMIASDDDAADKQSAALPENPAKQRHDAGSQLA